MSEYGSYASGLNRTHEEIAAQAVSYVESMLKGTPIPQHAPLGTASSNRSRLPSLTENVSADELIKLCAADTELFARTFFHRAMRQESPRFARDLWTALEGPHRFVNAVIFRGGSKTTRCRIYTLKNACYGLAHTILYIGKSERHARSSLSWIKTQVQFNSALAELFALRKGSKWTDEECEIYHGIDEYPIWVMGVGITGAIRGINKDDFRPDLVIMDDIHDEENSATEEQRQKIRELVYGAISESLAPASEAPHAKLINLATPLNREDICMEALKPGTGWHNIVIPCWTQETRDLPTHLQESIWPERWSSEELREKKEQAIARNMLSTFLRENELKLISRETSAFRREWLEEYDVLPEGMRTFLAIDPVPPPSSAQVAKNLVTKDFESLGIIGVWKEDYYVLELVANRGHDPSWTISEFFRLCWKWRPIRCFVEAVGYQRTLAWLLRKAMADKSLYYTIEEITDQRSKYQRIVDSLNATASMGHLKVPAVGKRKGDPEAWAMFFQQFGEYPSVNHDDVLEVVAICVAGAQGKFTSNTAGEEFDLEEERRQFPRLVYQRGAP